MSLIREYPNLNLSINVETPDGRQSRWGQDDPRAENKFNSLDFTTTMPGGFEHLDVTLERNPSRMWPDLKELDTLRVRGVGAFCAWEGRMETSPSVSGDQEQITPSGVGWQSHLTDDNSARELFVENDMTTWQAASFQRQLDALNANTDIDTGSFTGSNNGTPCLDTGFSGPWSRSHVCESWYDAKGLSIGQLVYAWQTVSPGVIGDEVVSTDPNWQWHAYLSTDDVESSVDDSGNLRGTGPSSGTLTATTTRSWANVWLYYGGAAGADGVSYDVYWTQLTLLGNQGLPIYTSVDGTPGLLGSDVMKYVIPKYAPRLKIMSAGQSTIIPSSFVIPELVFLDPVTANDMLTGVTQFELQDWAVWEGPTFWWYPRNSLGRKWRARVGSTKLNQAGPQIDKLWNGVVVTYTDYLGITRTVGPPGSNAQTIDSSLIDTSSTNATNVFTPTLRRWAPLQMDTGTAQSAIQVGKLFLQEQALVNQSGNATITGYIEDSSGVIWPAYCIRAGDQISFTDAADTSYRRIVSTDYNDDTKVNQVTLDSPPDSLQAILERLNVVLTNVS